MSLISFATSLKFFNLQYPKQKIGSLSYGTCVLCFKFDCSLSAIPRSTNDANIQLGNVVIDGMESLNDSANGEEEVDKTLIIMSKDAIQEGKDASSSEEESDEGSVEVQEEDSDSDESSSESNSDSESDDKMCLNMKHEKLIRQMHEHYQM